MTDYGYAYNEGYRDGSKAEREKHKIVLAAMQAKYEDARSLIDGCYEVVELFDAKTPSQVEWRRKWLEAARQHGANSF